MTLKATRPKRITVLGQTNEGDKFHFIDKIHTWKVTSKSGKTLVAETESGMVVAASEGDETWIRPVELIDEGPITVYTVRYTMYMHVDNHIEGISGTISIQADDPLGAAKFMLERLEMGVREDETVDSVKIDVSPDHMATGYAREKAANG